jgi:hypothetical protein
MLDPDRMRTAITGAGDPDRMAWAPASLKLLVV